MSETPDLLARLVALQETTNARLEAQTQRLDRQDATLAGISLTLVVLQSTLEDQAGVLARLDQGLTRFEAVLADHAQVLREIAATLKALVPPQPNGREA